MIRTLIASAALAAGLVGQAGAVTTVLVDDFEQFDLFVWNGGAPYATTDTGATMSNLLMRSVTHAYASPPADPMDGWLTTGPGFDNGQLSLANDVLSAIGTVSWALPAAFIPATSSGVMTLNFDVLLSDLLVNATLKLGTTTLGAQAFGGPGPVSFALGASQDVINAWGGTLALVFSGPAGYDMTIDNVRFEAMAPVPENSTALMLLAGLLATAGLRRRMAQNNVRA